MRANRNLCSIALMASFACIAQAQAPAGNASTGSVQPPGTQAMAAAPTAAASAPALARPSDTIGEAADRQRMQRMLASQAKPVVSSTGPVTQQPLGSGTVVGGINIERAPAGLVAPSKPQQPDMALVEILRGPKATMVAIEVAGVERRVAEGDDLGNGWRVKKVGRFTVDLEEYAGPVQEQQTATKQKGKAKASQPKKSLKTQTLSLKAPASTGAELQRSPIAR